MVATATKKAVPTPETDQQQLYADHFNASRLWVNKQIRLGRDLTITRGGREMKIVEWTKDGQLKVPNMKGDGFDYLPAGKHFTAILDGLVGD